MASSVTETQFVVVAVLATPFVCLWLFSLYLQWQKRKIYKRIGDYSIGSFTYHTQFDYPGVNFPGANILETKISAQPADIQEHVRVVRRRIRNLRWAILSYIGFLVILGLVISVVRKLSA
jgi:hypothetical protein